ncbi:putative guanine nucleotide-binding protein [Besnoitia besnoiti]|uniref:Putative guanine nucleotide-binding protein n=1 Tax=Besnoitia besnoiti TaxID=94643 RepID=A0A2A9M4T5_BESBE|nr:putative guanine nucleotide-binding protein [Besnoitia besnoiti]PFH31321.1 putative guanine nucleotide-binding protein [Besnoitia besnoiti]
MEGPEDFHGVRTSDEGKSQGQVKADAGGVEAFPAPSVALEGAEAAKRSADAHASEDAAFGCFHGASAEDGAEGQNCVPSAEYVLPSSAQSFAAQSSAADSVGGMASAGDESSAFHRVSSPVSLPATSSLLKPLALAAAAEAPFRAPLATSDDEAPSPLATMRRPPVFRRRETQGLRRVRPAAASLACPAAAAAPFGAESGRAHAAQFASLANCAGRARQSKRAREDTHRRRRRRNGNENCLRGAAWSVDGSAFLTWSEDAVVRLFATPEEEDLDFAGTEDSAAPATMDPWTYADEGELIFDCAWFPRLDWAQPRTYSYAVTSRDHPVHLYSGIDSSLLGTYSCYNHLDEVAHAYSLLFHPQKPLLLAGGISGVRTFDLERPGRQTQDLRFATRRAKQGQKGIISCMDFKRDGAGANRLFACGSYSQSVCVYSEEGSGRRNATPFTTPTHCLLDKDTSWGGVTQVKFVGDNLLASGHRQDSVLRCWDLRKPDAPMLRLRRETAQSGQKFAFDTCLFADPEEGDIFLLVTGDELGQMSFFSLASGRCISTQSNARAADAARPAACVAASFHPRRPLLLTAVGSRQFDDFTSSTASSSGGLSPASSDASDAEGNEGNSRSFEHEALCVTRRPGISELEYPLVQPRLKRQAGPFP